MKLDDTFCRCAIASGAIIPPPEVVEQAERPLAWLGILIAAVGSAILWALLAWLVTLVWWLV